MRVIGLWVAALIAIGLATSEAAAYPEFQLSTDNARCNQCHIAPAGGGLLNGYGRSESGDTISQFGGDGSFLHGAYEEPDWLGLGVDLRGMGLVRQRPGDDEPDTAVFPMQGDTYVALFAGDFTLYGAVGPRAQVRRPESVVDRFGVREYWLMWRPSAIGWYARAGRFHAPFGLRPQDHTRYIRRYQGLNIWEENLALSLGKVAAGDEVHLTAFAPVPFSLGGHAPGESGATAYWETRPGDQLVIGAQARVGFGGDSQRYTAGGVAKYWLAPSHLLVSGELDLTLERFDVADASRGQLTSYLAASWFPHTGWMLTATLERHAADLAVAGTARDTASVGLQYFPLAHFEIMVQGRVELAGSFERAQQLGFLQFHYYL